MPLFHGLSNRTDPIKYAYGAINQALTQNRRARSQEIAVTAKPAGGSPRRWRSHIIT